LPDRWVRRIAQFTIAAENRLGGPQDVEWAIAEGRVWMLQSRPVTALPDDFSLGTPFPLNEEDASGPLWEINGSSRRRVPLPLDLDVDAIRTAASTETMIHNGSTWGDSRNLSIRKIVNGRVYSRSVPSDLHLGDARIRKNASSHLAHRLRESGTTPWEHSAPEVMAATRRLSEFDVSTDDGAALADQLEDAFGAYRRHWAIHFSMPNGQAFAEPFLDAFIELTGREREGAMDAAYFLLEGAGNMLTRLVDGLYGLACAARGTSAEALLVSDENSDVVARLETLPDAGLFRKALNDFLDVYGDRSGLGVGDEPALYVPTWREKPELIFPMIAPYLLENVESPESLRSRMNEERDRQAEALCQKHDNEETVSAFRRWLPLMRRVRTDLENHNHYIDQMSVGQLRAAILAAGRWLSDRNVTAERDDVFWLHREEIDAALRSDSPESSQEKIAARKAQWEEWGRMTPPPLLGIPEPQLEPRPPFTDEVTVEVAEEDGILRGVGASAGKIRGRARVIPSGTQHPDVAPGEILVADYAGPAWTPLFPILGGLVLTRASLFHHAATTAREYGLPAVVNIKDATLRIPDRAWITLDGSTGEIVLE
jgi:pyruvate,water dikinase